MNLAHKVLTVTASLLAVFTALSAPIRSNLGGEGIEGVVTDDSPNPYISDGLIAMWDGEWNAGWGVHDDTITEWVDLTGNGFTAYRDSADGAWGDNYAIMDGTAALVGKTGSLLGKPSNITIEICYEIRYLKGMYAYFGCASDGGYSIFKVSSKYDHYCKGFAYPLTVTANPDVANALSTRTLAAGRGMCVYKDGELLASTSSGTAIQYNNSCGFVIGGDSTGSQWGVESSMTGYIYSVRVYDRQLSAEEVAFNHLVDIARFGE